MDKSTKFWNRIANYYSKKAIGDPAAYQVKLDLTQEYLTPETSVLEFGCGTGSTALIHAPLVKDVLAIDYSPKMIEIAQHKLSDGKVENVEFRKSTLEELPEAPESFEAVLGLSILHLVDDLDGSIQKSYEMLAPGGVFVTSTVCMANSNPLMKMLLRVGAAIGVIPSLKFLKVSDLETKMRRAGFEILKSIMPGNTPMSRFIIAKK